MLANVNIQGRLPHRVWKSEPRADPTELVVRGAQYSVLRAQYSERRARPNHNAPQLHACERGRRKRALLFLHDYSALSVEKYVVAVSILA